MHDAHEPGLAEVSGFTDYFLPVLEHVQADQRQLHFRRVAVVHAHQSGRSAAAAAPDVILIDDEDSSRLAFREMEGDRGAHDTGAQDHDIGGFCCIRHSRAQTTEGTESHR